MPWYATTQQNASSSKPVSWLSRINKVSSKPPSSSWLSRIKGVRRERENNDNYDFDASLDKTYPKHFPQQGQPNFLQYIRKYLLRVAGPFDIGCTPDRKMYAHQKVVKYTVTPDGPAQKLLVFHRAGAGKTRSIVAICNNFYFDPRPLIVIMPTPKTKQNFLKFLRQTPGRWSDFIRSTISSDETNYEMVGDHIGFIGKLKELEAINKQRGLAVTDTDELDMINKVLYNDDDNKETAHKKTGKVLYPAAPLRVFSFSETARKSFIIDAQNPITKWGKHEGWENPLDDTIILMDEFHNLYAPDHESVKNPKTRSNLNRLSMMMKKCNGSVIVGFTASPIITRQNYWGETQAGVNSLKNEWMKQFSNCMKIIQAADGAYTTTTGEDGKRSYPYSGYISYFYSGDGRIFPRTKGKTRWTLQGEKNPDKRNNEDIYAILPVQVQVVTLVGTNLVQYLSRLKEHLPSKLASEKPNHLEKVILPYCNQGYGKYKDPKNDTTVDAIMNGISIHSKLNAIALSIRRNPVKTLVLVHKHAGFNPVLRVLTEELSIDNLTVRGIKDKDDMHILEDFNDKEENDLGQKILCMVAEITQFGEGTDFYTVRRVIIVNPPDGLGRLHQLIGRVTRSCQFTPSFTEDAVVQVDMYVAQLPMRLLEHYTMARIKLTKDIKRLFYESLRGKSKVDPHSTTAGDYSDQAILDTLKNIGMDEYLIQEISSQGGELVKNDDKSRKIIRTQFVKLVTAWGKWRDVIAKREQGGRTKGATITSAITTALPNNSDIVEGLMTADIMRATRLVREQWAYSDFINQHIINNAIDGHFYDDNDVREHV